MILGAGVDLLEVERVRREIRRGGAAFEAGVFTPAEIAYCRGKRYPARHFAARFAAKEAVLKALGTGWRNGISWQDIEVGRLPSGRPSLRLRGRCAEIADDLRIASWHVSLSHTAGSAIASVLGCG